MRLEQRIEYLLRAALRAERDGDHQVARSLRRMAEDMLPIERPITSGGRVRFREALSSRHHGHDPLCRR